jgi:hypothetical protein
MMKPFRPSIATLGACIALLAFDLAILRFQPGNDLTYLALFTLPIVNLLVIAFYLGRVRRRLGKSNPFLRWFQIIGWVEVASYLAWSHYRYLDLSWPIAVATRPVFEVTLNNLSFDVMQRLDPSFVLAWKISKAAQSIVAAAIVSGVLLLPAVIGGMIAQHRHRKRSSGAMPIAQPVVEMDTG